MQTATFLLKFAIIRVGYKNGAPKMTRTSDTQFRKLLLYPAELWAHRHAQIFRAKISYHEKVGL